MVNFAHFRDREEVLSKSKLLRGTNVYITEDLSRKVREHRNELTKFMREVNIFIFFEKIYYILSSTYSDVVGLEKSGSDFRQSGSGPVFAYFESKV